jgi:valyl-tRNA synthetase
MLGDTAVAVHPEDERYKHLVGKTVVLPLVGREIPIIADEYSDPEKGSGAVKITPAHDFNDYEVYRRHPEIGLVNIFDAEARIISSLFIPAGSPQAETSGDELERIPKELRGLDRFAARKRVVEMIEALGLVEKIEPHVHPVPHAQRGDAVIEPWLTEQWYVNATELAKRAIEAVESGKTGVIRFQRGMGRMAASSSRMTRRAQWILPSSTTLQWKSRAPGLWHFPKNFAPIFSQESRS